jgi:hypothetical protein
MPCVRNAAKGAGANAQNARIVREETCGLAPAARNRQAWGGAMGRQCAARNRRARAAMAIAKPHGSGTWVDDWTAPVIPMP